MVSDNWPGRYRIRLVRARGVWGRLCGLLGRARPPGEGIGFWLFPCWAVHTIGMRYPIDIAFVDHQGRVRRLARHIRPGRVVCCPGAESVIELRVNDKDTPLRYQRRLHVALRKQSSRQLNRAAD